MTNPGVVDQSYERGLEFDKPNETVTNFYLSFQAYVVLGQYLVLKKNQELFQDWMKDTCGANTKQSKDCYQCLNDWCEEFL